MLATKECKPSTETDLSTLSMQNIDFLMIGLAATILCPVEKAEVSDSSPKS